MTPEDLERMKVAQAEALALPPEQRDELLRTQFPDEPELLEGVRRLLHWNGEAGDFLKTPIVSRIAGPCAQDLGIRRVGPYELVRELGRGGSATVYLARRADDLFEKQVAIKVLNRLSHSEEDFRRFQREIQVLARLEHAFIVRLLEAGTTGEALAYIVTEFVDGKPIGEYAAGLPLREKLLLFLKVCAGVAAAHRNLIVHRDIKPTNILVAQDGTPKVLDFGIAVLLDQDSRFTETGLERMTLQYASPEQVRRENITTSTDVYSLGVLLYEVVSGHSPYVGARHELPVRILSDNPLPLKNAPRELGAIVQHAMEKDPGRRYESVDRLRDDVTRFLEGSPVSAHGNSVTYRLKKFAGKHWLSLSAALVTAIVLAILSFVSIASSREAKRQSERIKELLAHVLHDVALDREERTSLLAHRRVAETKLNYLNSLAQEYPNDFQLARMRFDALRVLGNTLGLPSTLNLGETTKARDNLMTAVRIGEEILARWGEGTLSHNDLALTHIELGSILLEMNQPVEARSRFDRAERLVESAPVGSGVRAHLEALAQKSRILNLGGRQSEALLLRAQVVEGRRELFERDAKGLEWEYAGALCSYGWLLREMGRFDEAEKSYSDALPMIEEGFGRDPRSLDGLWHLARENEEYAKVLLSLGRTAPAMKHLDRAIALYHDVKRKEPDAMSNLRALAVCEDLLGSELVKQGELQRGRQLMEDALSLSVQSARSDPGSFRAQQELAAIRANRSRWGSLSRLQPAF